MREKSGILVSIDIWPFHSKVFQKSTDSAWIHPNGSSYGPCIAYYRWANASDDDFWLNEIERALGEVRRVALSNGCSSQDIPLYMNTALDTVSVKDIYKSKYESLRQLRKNFDPYGVMDHCSGFRIPFPDDFKPAPYPEDPYEPEPEPTDPGK